MPDSLNYALRHSRRLFLVMSLGSGARKMDALSFCHIVVIATFFVAALAWLFVYECLFREPLLSVVNVRLIALLKPQLFFELVVITEVVFENETLQAVLGALYFHAARVNCSTYSLRVSFLSWTMAFNAAIAFGCFLLAVKSEVISSHNFSRSW